MKHFGNVCEVKGDGIEPVDVITFGSPCQDMSIAGKRKGIKHSNHGDEQTTRSGLFYEAIRIIEEMRKATHGEYPKYAVWENVPGAFSSNKGWDFLAVLEALCSICDDTISIPRPYDKRKPDKLVWSGAGEIVGSNYSICWRTLDAQYWGVPQRRKRIYLVTDFNTRCAREILFKPDGLRRNLPQGNGERETAPADALGSTDGSIGDVAAFMAGQGAKAGSIAYNEEVSPTLKSTLSGGNTIPSVIVQDGSTIARTLAARYDSSPCTDRGQNVIAIDKFAYNCGKMATGAMNIKTDGIAPTHGNSDHPPAICFVNRPHFREDGKSETIRSECHSDTPCIAYDARNHTAQEISSTLQAHSDGGTSLNFINPVCYQNTGRGWWNQSEIAETLRTPSGGDSTKANLVSMCYDARGNGDGKTVSTITGDHESRITDYTALVVGNGQLNQVRPSTKTGALNCMHDQQAVVTTARLPRKYIIRRLMPVECARLQGFPDRWGELAPFNPVDTEFWESVRKTYAEINGKEYKPCKNLKKWYDKLHNDGAEYKMWGNGIAFPCAEYVLHGISERGVKTLGSLFDGSGGFPLAGAINGIIPLWASEIEPYPIAVTKSRFEERSSHEKQTAP